MQYLTGISKKDRMISVYFQGKPFSITIIQVYAPIISAKETEVKWFYEGLLDLLVQFSCSVMSDSLQPHEPQHTRPPCPSPTPGAHPNPCPANWWCHPTISSSVVPFSSLPQSFPASGSFQMSQIFTSGGQSIGVSASTSVFQWTPRTDLL